MEPVEIGRSFLVDVGAASSLNRNDNGNICT